VTRRWGPLVLFLVIARLPGFVWGALNIDESDYLVFGKMWTHGALPYVDFAEKKPLLAYAFYAPSAVTGYAVWPVELLALAWILATAALIGAAVARWTDDRKTGWIATWLVVLAYAGTMPGINSELVLNLPVAAAIYFYVCGRSELLVGLMIGLATMVKQQAGITLVVVHIALVLDSERNRIDRHLRLLAGCILPWLLAASGYAAAGHFDAFFEWNITRNLSYASRAPGSALLRLADGVLNCILMSAPIHWWLAISERRRDSVYRFLLFGLVLTWIPVSLGGRFYPHYFQQFIPWVCAAAAPGAARLWASRRRLAILLFAAPLAFYLVDPWIRGATRDYPTQDPATVEVAHWLQEHTSPDEKIFVWGHFTPIYLLSDRMPGTRYIACAVLIGDFDPSHVPDGFDIGPYAPAEDIARTIEDLETNRVPIVVDVAPANINKWGKFPLAAVPALDRYVQRNYSLVGRPGGAAVYRRRSIISMPSP